MPFNRNFSTKEGTPGQKADRWRIDVEAHLENLLEGAKTLQETRQLILEYFAREVDTELSTTALCSQNYTNRRITDRVKFFGEVQRKILNKEIE